jgi:glycerol-3-phosphate dehydrogenase
MRRQLERLANEEFDIHVIGGGATGACIARDAALRGLKVALSEKNDFAHATSAHNSKLVHGGLRYLRNFELGLVRESLKERRIWQRIAPHLVRPLPFLVPLFDGGFRERATLSAGLALYDLLSFDRGWLDDPDQRLPGHRWFDRAATAALEPSLGAPGLVGSFLYYDAQMYAPERLALECLIDADAHGAAIANHLEAEQLLLREGVCEGTSMRCTLTGARFDIRARLTIVATGPWADIFLGRALGEAAPKLVRSKGIHVVVPAMTDKHALTVATPHGHFFVLPWRGHTLLGTTDTAFTGLPDAVQVSDRDIDAFLAFVNEHLPNRALSRKNVLHAYAGLRPLVADGAKDTYAASRRAELIDHAKSDRVEGLLSAIGGKWTTSRDLAEKVVDAAAAKLGAKTRPAMTATTLLPGGRIGSLGEFRSRYTPREDHLARLYGSRLDKVMALARDSPALSKPLSPTGDIGAQIVFAVHEEMALTLEDAIMRRTGIGQLGAPAPEMLDFAAAAMANALAWSEARKAAEIASLAPLFRTTGGGT